MAKHRIYYDTVKNCSIIATKETEKTLNLEYLCTASLKEIEEEIDKRERVKRQYRFRFKRLGIDRLDEIAKMLKTRR